jgi:6-phosphogluconolactonase
VGLGFHEHRCLLNNHVRKSLFLASISIGFCFNLAARSSETKERFYISSFSKDGNGGIQLAELDGSTGELRVIRLVAPIKNSSFLAIHPNRRYLYATSKSDKRGGPNDDAVSAFEIDKKTGDLKLLNHQPSAGANPCHIGFDRSGTHAFVSNYDGGNVAVLPIGADGRLREATSVVARLGSSLGQVGQAILHPHEVVLDASDRFAYVPDLGLDKVLVFRYDAAQGALSANGTGDFSGTAGAGPRHFLFHPSGTWAYVINELSSTITVLEYDPISGKLTAVDVKSTLSEPSNRQNDAAEIIIHPGGRFLYGSNRGHDSIAMFLIDQSNGHLTSLGCQPAGGRTPTSICFDSTGRFLVSANLDSDNLVLHEVDLATGKLSQRLSCKALKPICIVRYPG